MVQGGLATDGRSAALRDGLLHETGRKTKKKNPFKKLKPKLRRAFPEDITIGNIIVYPATEISEEFTKFVIEVLRPSDNWKAFSAEDGCRYGLEGHI